MAFWQGKRVLVTGHTGFKGGWLVMWLSQLGARVAGLALPPPTTPSLFAEAGLERLLTQHHLANLCDAVAVSAAMQQSQPEIVLHLAAQPLVRYSYQHPAETYASNVMGTLHLLEAIRHTPSVRSVVCITTDKCYDNREWPWPYREQDALGGHDPYSSSKACVELLCASYRQSFLHQQQVALATARAGNVIGGGDWASDRLVPDFLRAMDAGQPLLVRSPAAVRPWQHVLEPLAGYLQLARALHEHGDSFADAWNFGPADEDARPVGWIADTLCRLHGTARWQQDGSPQPHEAHTLKLDSSKARARLGWQPRWHLQQALQHTLAWHQAWRRGDDMLACSQAQIAAYLQEPA